MKSHRHLHASRYRKGFSLIELMLAMAIGLVIAAASFSVYLAASGTSRMAEAQGRMNEDAQAALSILTQQLRMAGSNPNQSDRINDASRRNPVYGATSYPTGAYTMSNFILRGCDGKFKPTAGSGPERLDNLVCDDQVAEPDSLAVSYEADRFNTIPTALGDLPSDCLGSRLSTIVATLPAPGVTVPKDFSYAVAVNRFYVDVSTAQVPSLYCKGSGLNDDGSASTPKPLVENIEDIQLSYGAVKASTAAADVASAVMAGYLTAHEVVTQVNMAALANDAERWAKVVTVRICILARSETAVVSDAASARYLKCDGTLETNPPDLRLRRAYFATVVLRNRRSPS
ncbi:MULTISPECIES: PilW family protein [unclassified Polaromonas]|uniref:PilW family protein n=1 Tax=unclassified Polaromonas TaxID=2638319 RepID=UPI0018C9D59B|nr:MULTISPECIES: PilW family protein [unclassified Polaromonas]MBG6073561.1 type IV pilus assembly protein PilW [Polaromonas sp. CG_9.7]MBG6115563.1 type IV pilus assembly protein PilW [Polaromonas sp. CG_9.2]MDH6185876.1 type IV pilus assembly protein PilW [Polaromonas sp. CG_23.6]